MRRLFTLLVLVLLVGFYGCNGDFCSEVFFLEHYPQITPPVVYPYSWKMAL